MSEAVLKVALVEDDDDLRASLAQQLQLAGHAVAAFPDGPSALAAIGTDFPGIVVTDVRMPRMSGLELFRALHERDPELPVILMTGHGDVRMAVDALKAGAWDFLSKPFEPDQLAAAVTRALTTRGLLLDNRQLRAQAAEADSPLVGQSPAIAGLRQTVAILADAAIDVLVEGETGTGKELIARMIHRSGRRARNRFVTLACAATADGLIDTAVFAPDGLVASAHRGTLFLDDVDRASPLLQARLAQLVEERALVSPGGANATDIDLRVVATKAEGAASTGAIDPALYHRLAAVRLRVPPLRERREDVPLIFASLLDTAAGRLRVAVPRMDGASHRHLLTHDWPGNVRELAFFAERIALGLDPREMPASDHALSLPRRMDAFEAAAISQAIADARGDIGAAIAMLGLPRKTFYYRARRLGIDIMHERKQARERAPLR